MPATRLKRLAPLPVRRADAASLLQGPAPLIRVLSRMHAADARRRAGVLAWASAQAELREIWIRVHTAAGSVERAEEIRRELRTLERQIDRALDRHLGELLHLTPSEV